MFKYPVKDFKEFYSCMSILKPVYIEKQISYVPIPELQGLIYPFIKDNKIVIFTITIDENTHMTPHDFKKMIININLDGECMGKLLTLDDSLQIYDLFSQKDYNLFVLDTSYDELIEKV